MFPADSLFQLVPARLTMLCHWLSYSARATARRTQKSLRNVWRAAGHEQLQLIAKARVSLPTWTHGKTVWSFKFCILLYHISYHIYITYIMDI